MKKRKNGNSLERLKKVCERNGIELSGIPSDKLIIIDENNTEHIVNEDFNLFNSYNATLTYKKIKFSKSIVSKKIDYKPFKEELDYKCNNIINKAKFNYDTSTLNTIHKLDNKVA